MPVSSDRRVVEEGTSWGRKSELSTRVGRRKGGPTTSEGGREEEDQERGKITVTPGAKVGWRRTEEREVQITGQRERLRQRKS